MKTQAEILDLCTKLNNPEYFSMWLLANPNQDEIDEVGRYCLDLASRLPISDEVKIYHGLGSIWNLLWFDNLPENCASRLADQFSECRYDALRITISLHEHQMAVDPTSYGEKDYRILKVANDLLEILRKRYV